MAGIRDMVGDAVSDAAHNLDAGSVRALYAAVSVPVEQERVRLRRARRAFVDPAAQTPVEPAAVGRTAQRVIDQASVKASAMGGAAGFGGVATVPPEILGMLVAIVRMGQRLAIVYGFDPDTDRGQMALRSALSAGLGVELPEGGPLGLAASDLPRVLLGSVPTEPSVAMTQALVRQSAWLVVGSVARFVPGLAIGVGAYRSSRQIRRVGETMRASLAAAAGLMAGDTVEIVEAVEVPNKVS